jgi:hypothetical protein
VSEPTPSTRRAFVKATVKKAAYVAPAVLALRAAERAGADFTGCVGPGSLCTADSECCTSYLCLKPNMNPCMGQSDCTCQ